MHFSRAPPWSRRAHTCTHAHRGKQLELPPCPEGPEHGLPTAGARQTPAEERGEGAPRSTLWLPLSQVPTTLSKTAGGAGGSVESENRVRTRPGRLFPVPDTGAAQARCSREPLPPCRVSARSALAAATVCHFPLPQGLGIVLCPVASALTHARVPPRPPGPSFDRASDKEPLFFPETRPRRAGQAPHPPLPEIAGSSQGTGQGRDQLCVLLGTQLHIRHLLSSHFIDENTEVQRKEGLVFRD